MSRIGKKAIDIVSGVKVNIADNNVKVEGPKGKLELTLPPLVSAKVDGEKIIVESNNNTRQAKAMHGLGRSLINNMVIGVTQGYSKSLTIIGVGYKAQLSGSILILNLGFSHTIEFKIPKGITITVTKNTSLLIEGIDKQMVGQVAAEIRAYRKPEPYKGKGVRYSDEQVTIKEGKKVG